MFENLERLKAVGFRLAGKWTLSNNVLRLVLEPSVMHETNVLYAFTVDGAVKYVGKTTQSLVKRMQGYRCPASSAERGGSTNIKNNQNIRNALASNSTVEIYVLHALPNQMHGEFSVNLSAGLEDSLIKTLAPPWNGKVVPNASESVSVRASVEAARQQTSQTAPGQVRSSAEVPSPDSLLSFCRQVQGRPLLTMVRKTPFRVDVHGGFLEITPTSSGGSRRESKANISALLARFEKTRSFRMSDYQDVSFNASYLLALVKAWQSQRFRL